MAVSAARLYWKTVDRLKLSEVQQSLFWAAIIGASGGLAAWVFLGIIQFLNEFLFSRLPTMLGYEQPTEMGWQFIQPLIPMIGGLLVAPIILRWAIEARGHGVPEVMLAMSREGGRIRPRVGAVKAIASGITLGSGGSAGQEGPIVQIGSALGSLIGQWLHMPARKVKTFVACGAAAGISAVFNAPLAGVFFAIEVLLGELRPRSFSYVVLASATAWVVAGLLMGHDQILNVPEWQFLHAEWECFFWVILGALAAVVGRLFVVSLYWFEDFYQRLKLSPYLKPALGGLCVGLIGILFPHVFGSGYKEMSGALHGTVFFRLEALDPRPFIPASNQNLIEVVFPTAAPHPLIDMVGGSGPILHAIMIMALLAFAKILATSFTLGSGGSGGVFAPSLFIGAMLGGSFGLLLQLGFPNSVTPAGAYAVVGMAACFAGAAHAPVTAILIIFELTRNDAILPAIMVASVVATLLSYRLAEDSIYTVKFKRRGLRIGDSQVRDPLKQITVRDAMASEFFSVQPTMTMRQALLYAETVGQRAYPVVGERETDLRGLVTLYDLNLAMANNQPDTTPIEELMDTEPILVTPDDYLDTAVTRLEDTDAQMLPVIAAKDDRRLIGVLTHATMIRAYNEYQMERE